MFSNESVSAYARQLLKRPLGIHLLLLCSLLFFSSGCANFLSKPGDPNEFKEVSITGTVILEDRTLNYLIVQTASGGFRVTSPSLPETLLQSHRVQVRGHRLTSDLSGITDAIIQDLGASPLPSPVPITESHLPNLQMDNTLVSFRGVATSSIVNGLGRLQHAG